VKKTGSNLISFPKSRRSEQTGLTHRGFPLKWVGLVVMTTVGAAWALNPGQEVEEIPAGPRNVKQVMFEGEPQVVAQLMGAVVGTDGVPQAELRSLSRQGASERRVVVVSRSVKPVPVEETAPFLAEVERLETEMAETGRYPAIPSEISTAAGYRTTGDSFKLESESFYYDSGTGFMAQNKEQAPVDASFRVAGFLEAFTSGWGPWKQQGQKFAATSGQQNSSYSWLEQGEPTPDWSARMYFPVNRETTGYAFRRGDGTTRYSSGEVLYDAVSGTFQLKLYRGEIAQTPALDAKKLESKLAAAGPGCELVGDPELLQDLGFLSRPETESEVVRVSSPLRLPMSAVTALDGLALSAFSKHQSVLEVQEFQAASEADSNASLVGRVSFTDKLGQVHQVRLRSGRASDYDWVVGQLCPQAEEAEVPVSQAYEDSFQRKTESTVIAGK